jgi:hypothetical protein
MRTECYITTSSESMTEEKRATNLLLNIEEKRNDDTILAKPK